MYTTYLISEKPRYTKNKKQTFKYIFKFCNAPVILKADQKMRNSHTTTFPLEGSLKSLK